MLRRMVFGSPKPIGVALPAVATPSRTHTHSHSHGYSAMEHGEHTGRYHRQCQIATAVGCATNVFFSTTKIWLGSSGGSVALVADGFHALTDILADIVSFTTLSLSRKKLPRCRFPFGIGRLETSGAIFVSAILLLGGVTLLVQSFWSCAGDVGRLVSAMGTTDGAMGRVFQALAAAGYWLFQDPAQTTAPGQDPAHAHAHAHPQAHGADHNHSHFQLTQYDTKTGEAMVMWAMVLLASSSVVCKEMLFRWSKRVGERAGSRVVVANAYHHRADAWSSGVALIGVGGQMLGIPGVDGISGLVVSLSICQIGYGLLRDAILEFFDFQRADDVAQVREKLMKFYVHLEDQEKLRLGVSDSDSDSEVVKDLLKNPPPSPLIVKSTKSKAPPAHVATDVGSSQGASKDNKMRFVNVFLTRHGRFYVVHMKILLRDDFTALQLQTALSKLNAYLSRNLSIQDVFASVQVCSETVISRDKYIKLCNNNGAGQKNTEKKDGEVRIAAQGNLVNPTLEECLHMLIDFHVFPHGIQYSWEIREIYTSFEGNTDCFRDMESVAKMFNCKLIATESKKDK